MIVLIMISSTVYKEYNQFFFIKRKNRSSLVAHWLRLHASTVGGTSSIPGHRTKIPHAAQCSQKNKEIKTQGCHSEDIPKNTKNSDSNVSVSNVTSSITHSSQKMESPTTKLKNLKNLYYTVNSVYHE